MKVTVIDDGALANVSPRNVRLYLQTRGWVRQSPAGSRPDIWALESPDGTYEVIAPSSRETKDFATRMGEMLRTLAINEERSQIDILRDLSNLSFDIQYIRAAFPGPSGTAPLRDAAAAFDAAQNMLSASTAAMEEPRLVLPTRRSPQTTRFMRSVLAGPTGEGSYVISILVPVPPRLTQEEDQVLFDDPAEPFARTATRHLNRALIAVKDAAQDAADLDVGLDAFLRRETSGVSANLCEAVVALAGEESVPVTVHFSWALDRPVSGLAASVDFGVDVLPVLESAAQELRARVPEEDVRLRGNIVRLHREGHLGAGEVTISGIVAGDVIEKMRRVSVSLAEPDYERAIRAHASFADVEIVGTLEQRGTRTYLREARGFEVRPPADAS